MKKHFNDTSLSIAFIAVMTTFPLWSNSPNYTAQMVLLGAIYAIALLGLDFVVGYAGALSIGHAALFGIGAYTTGALTTHLHWAGWLTLPFTLVTGGIIGWIMSLPLLKANDKYVALGTLVFGLSISIILSEWNSLTGGAIGLSLPPQIWLGIQLTTMHYAYLGLALLALSLYGVQNISRSTLGRSFQALRDAPIAADCMGIHVIHHKQIAFIIAGMLAGLAGGLFALSQGYIAPSSFSFEMSVTLLLALMLGGKKRQLGSLLGALIVIYLPILLAPMIEWKPIIYGSLILTIIYALPNGLAGLIPISAHTESKKGTTQEATGIHIPSNAQHRLPLLSLEAVTLNFGAFKALDNISFNVEQKNIVGVIGPNGAGKSTLMNILTGIYQPNKGHVTFNNAPITTRNSASIAQAGIARTFQNLQIFCGLTVFENVLAALHHQQERNPFKIALGWHHKRDQAAHQRAWELLNTVGLTAHANQRAGTLSYGQKRFLEIGRALACNPKLLLLDEPAAGMRGQHLDYLKELIQRIKEHGIAILLIEHHMDVITSLSDQIIALNFGELIAQGLPLDVTSHPHVKEAYLGS